MDQPYYMATFAEVPEDQFRQMRQHVEEFGGEARVLEAEIIPYSARVANAADAKPEAGDMALINRWGRIDGFTSGGRHYIGTES